MQPGDGWPAREGGFEVVVTVVEAVERDLAKLAKRLPKIDESAEAANAVALAREMDSANSATSKSMCARALNETMALLRAMCPPEAPADALDDLSKRRETRRARVAKA